MLKATTARPLPTPLSARRGSPLSGTAFVPGDKSISHRALMIGALAVGKTKISGLLDSEDVRATARALGALGATTLRSEDGTWHVCGTGVAGLRAPDDVINVGNSGTSARLLAGLIAGQPISAVVTGDASLRRRPMARVIEPLQRMGVRIEARNGGCLPMTVTGASDLISIEYKLPVPSAQVKSALLLAGLAASGKTTIVESQPTRDHSERMLRYFGAEIEVSGDIREGQRIVLTGQPELKSRPLIVPTDPSSAAFAAVATCLIPDSLVNLPGICTNPERTGLYLTLQEMGAHLDWSNEREDCGEPVADLTVKAGPLSGVAVPAERAPSMIDEYPILGVAAACAEGKTVMRGIGELRVKESDRLGAMARGLSACGVRVEEAPDALIVYGTGKPPTGGAKVAVGLDHRIAMSFLILGLVTEKPITVDDGRPIDSSFPSFTPLMRGLGANIASVI